MNTRLARLVAVAGAAAVVAACGQSGAGTQRPAAAGSPINLVASTDVWANVAKAVGGDQVSTKAIITDPSGDPHSYQVTPKDAAALSGAALVVYNGGGYDDFVERALGAGGPRRIKAVDLHPDETAKPGAETGENEHVWYDLPTVARIASEIAEQLGEIRSSAKDTFVANADSFKAKISALEGKVTRLQAVSGGKSVVATEPVGHYLLEAAKLTDVTPVEFAEAIEEENDPPAAAVAEIQRMITERRVSVLVRNPQTETPVVADLVTKARAAGVPLVEMTETLPAGKDYLTWMDDQIQALATAVPRQ